MKNLLSLRKLIAIAAICTGILAQAASTFVGERDDFRDETIYFAMTTRFYDGDPKNNVCGWDRQNIQIANNDPDWRGDFKGLIDKLDYIKALGFTAIWITPVTQNCSGTDFHGYHSMDFTSVDLRYESRTSWGSSEDVTFQSLIDAVHAKGMKIILDIVLNHTGNFGEANLNPLFTRSQDIRNQASVADAVIPNAERLGADYNDLDGKSQYQRRFKYFKNPQYDTHNYYHHYGTGWNWDLPNRWWAQIAGDCVDLNTENETVSDYLIKCYGKFIEMGVDGFRIDTTGHISRLTFNTVFIPQFIALGEKYKDKRLNGCPFYMFGECCARFGSVIYRNQHNLSSHFYTWKSPESLTSRWNHDASWWDSQVLPEGHDSPVGNMALCEEETEFNHNSNNVFMQNGAWHEPDYSEASGFNVIDFPMHYNFNSAGQAVSIAKEGDHYYNDASYNVVYVDSHDYCPGPNDGTRFNGGTSQWAENLSLMFTFRGIPCIYYGSEVEFQKGKKVDAGGSDTPVKESGRAYFGQYLEGNVSTSDFGKYTASGNVAATLGGDLSQHIIRLNQIRAAVPALRKGQYTWDGCTAKGGWAFKRAYKDSYALVAINGGATFTNVPAGTFTDLVTGQTYQGGGTITVDAPQTKGQLRVLVKDWTGGKVGEDGKFIYATTPVAKGGNPTFADPGTTEYYTAADAVGTAKVTFNPAGGTFKTETTTISATLNDVAASGWYQVAGSSRVNLSAGETKTFTIGEGMNFGDIVTVNWSANSESGETYTGSTSYKKVDPNATITIYVKSTTAPYFYAWCQNSSGANVEPNGAWPGKQLSDSKEINGEAFYYFTFDDTESANFILNNGSGAQTSDIEGITEDSFYEWDGGSGYTKLEGYSASSDATVKLSPNGGSFVDTITITATVRNASSAWYKIGNGSQIDIDGTSATFTLGADMQVGESVTVSWSATGKTGTKTGSATYTKTEKVENFYTIYFDNTNNWPQVYIYFYGGELGNNGITGAWPGTAMTYDNAAGYYKFTFTTDKDATTSNVIFHNGSGTQTGDNVFIRNNGIYSPDGDTGKTGIESIDADTDKDEKTTYYNLQGIEVKHPANGIYIVKKGNKVTKAYIRRQ